MKKNAFSLAEMIITLLILSIIMAASAPLITKRHKLVNKFDSFWRENSNNLLYYKEEAGSVIGVGKIPTNKNYIMHLQSGISETARNIAFYDTESEFVGSLGFYGENVYFGKGTITGNDNIIIGNAGSGTIDGNRLLISPLSKYDPLIEGKFSGGENDPYVAVNGNFNVNGRLTENSLNVVNDFYLGGDLDLQNHNLFNAILNNPSIANAIIQNSELSNGITISGATITNGEIAASNFTGGEIIESKINTSEAATFSGEVYFNGSANFTNATVNGLRADLNTGDVSSDERLKDNITDSKVGLDQIRKVEIKDYKWKDKRDKDIHTGVVAQEFQKIFPHLVKEDSKGYLRIQPIELIFVAINAIKDLDRELQTLKKEIVVSVQSLEYKNLVEENNRLKSEIEDLKVKNKEFIGRLEKLENKLEK